MHLSVLYLFIHPHIHKNTRLYVAPITPYIFIWAIIGSILYAVFGVSMSHVLISFISKSRLFKQRRLSHYSIQ